MTDSDAALRRALDHERRTLAVCEAKGHRWTAERCREKIVWLESQLALLRSERVQWQPGRI